MIKIFGGGKNNHLPRVETDCLVPQADPGGRGRHVCYAHLASVAQAAGFLTFESVNVITHFTQVFPQEMSYRRVPIVMALPSRELTELLAPLILLIVQSDIQRLAVLHPTYWVSIAPEAVSLYQRQALAYWISTN